MGTTIVKSTQSAMPILNLKVNIRPHIGGPPPRLFTLGYLGSNTKRRKVGRSVLVLSGD
jgi:hypothetical protein